MSSAEDIDFKALLSGIAEPGASSMASPQVFQTRFAHSSSITQLMEARGSTMSPPPPRGLEARASAMAAFDTVNGVTDVRPQPLLRRGAGRSMAAVACVDRKQRRWLSRSWMLRCAQRMPAVPALSSSWPWRWAAAAATHVVR